MTMQYWLWIQSADSAGHPTPACPLSTIVCEAPESEYDISVCCEISHCLASHWSLDNSHGFWLADVLSSLLMRGS